MGFNWQPLPGRANIVLTNSISWRAAGAIVVNSFKDAITKADEWIDINMEINQNIIQKKYFYLVEQKFIK